MSAIKRLLSHPGLRSVVREYLKTWFTHPCEMGQEHSRFLSSWLLNREEIPEDGIRFENHCHSHFSDGAELSSIVDHLFANGISLWSLTDHDNSDAFDALLSGEYRLPDNYEIEAGSDPRHLTIHSDDKELVLLRSVELMTQQGEICVHGYEGAFPEAPLPLEDAISAAHDMGGYVVVNHPYLVNLGLGDRNPALIERAVQAGALALEKNGLETGPLLYSPARAEREARRLDVPIVCSGDAHNISSYCKSGIAFDEEEYAALLEEECGSHADVIRTLIASEEFESYLNYASPTELVRSADRKMAGFL